MQKPHDFSWGFVTLLGPFSNQIVSFFKQLFDLKGVITIIPLESLVKKSLESRVF
jgi:hypothetical protein